MPLSRRTLIAASAALSATPIARPRAQASTTSAETREPAVGALKISSYPRSLYRPEYDEILTTLPLSVDRALVGTLDDVA